MPFITIVVPALNEESHVRETLQDLLTQDYPGGRYEVIVADGGSTDGTRAVVESLQEARESQIRLVHNPGRLASAARNVGFRFGKGDFFIVIDAHCKVENRRLLRDMVETFERTGAFALGRPQPLEVAGNGLIARTTVLARSSALGHSLRSDIYSDSQRNGSIVSTGAMYRREVLEVVGSVDERFDACEDVDFNYRIEKAGLKTHFDPRLAVHYFGRRTLGGLFRQMFRYGLGRFRFMRKHPEATSLETLVPAAFVGTILLTPLGVALGSSLVYILVPLLGIYCITVGVFSASIAARSGDWAAMWALPLVYPVIHAGLGMGFLCGLFKAVR